jgi:hypothetical protein
MDRLPTAAYVIARQENDIWRSLVTIHKAFDVATIPGIFLCIKYSAHRRNDFCITIGFCLLASLRVCPGRRNTNRKYQGGDK